MWPHQSRVCGCNEHISALHVAQRSPHLGHAALDTKSHFNWGETEWTSQAWPCVFLLDTISMLLREWMGVSFGDSPEVSPIRQASLSWENGPGR